MSAIGKQTDKSMNQRDDRMGSVEQGGGALNPSVGGKRSFLRGHHSQTEKDQKELGKMRQGKCWDKEEKLVKGAASTMALRLRQQSGLISKSGLRDIKKRRARDESGEIPWFSSG